MELLAKITYMVKTYRKTAVIGVVAIIGALEAFGFTGLGATLRELYDAFIGAVPAVPVP